MAHRLEQRWAHQAQKQQLAAAAGGLSRSQRKRQRRKAARQRQAAAAPASPEAQNSSSGGRRRAERRQQAAAEAKVARGRRVGNRARWSHKCQGDAGAGWPRLLPADLEELEEEEAAMAAEAAYEPSCFQWKHCGAELDGGWELDDPDDSD